MLLILAATTSLSAQINHSTSSRRSRHAARQPGNPEIARPCVLLRPRTARELRKPGASPLNTRSSLLAWSLRSSRPLPRAAPAVAAAAKVLADVDVVVMATALHLNRMAVPAILPQHNHLQFPRVRANQLASTKDFASASYPHRCPMRLPPVLFLELRPTKSSNAFRKAVCSFSKLLRSAIRTTLTALRIPILLTLLFATISPQ